MFFFRCDNDSTIQHFNYGMSSVQRFRIQAFRFLTQHRFVYIHCDLVVCNRNYLNSTCARGNTCSHRYRRDVNRMSSSDDSSRMYALSFGPLMYSKETGDDHEKNTGWYCTWTTKCIHIYKDTYSVQTESLLIHEENTKEIISVSCFDTVVKNVHELSQFLP